jgi:thiol:disulfide interchange protein DsbD
MEGVKKVFGVILLGVAIDMIAPVIPAVVQMLLWAALLVVSAIFLRAIDALPAGASTARKLGKGIGVLALLAGVAVLIGALSGGRDLLRPLAGLGLGATDTSPAAGPTRFQRITSRAELDNAVRRAGRPVMLDFYADWCVSCKEMEQSTFTDPRVRARFDRMLLLQVDVTENLPEQQALLKRFNLFGPPGIIFFDHAGSEIAAARVIGFQSADAFTTTLDQAVR